MKHKLKIKIARKLRSKEEVKGKVPIFLSNAWESRKKEISSRVKRKQEKK